MIIATNNAQQLGNAQISLLMRMDVVTAWSDSTNRSLTWLNCFCVLECFLLWPVAMCRTWLDPI
jgi:hypothetical protein